MIIKFALWFGESANPQKSKIIQILCQPLYSANVSAGNVFLSHQISISHQAAASQQYFSLTTNQHQLPATASRTERHILHSLIASLVLMFYHENIPLLLFVVWLQDIKGIFQIYYHAFSDFMRWTRFLCKFWNYLSNCSSVVTKSYIKVMIWHTLS